MSNTSSIIVNEDILELPPQSSEHIKMVKFLSEDEVTNAIKFLHNNKGTRLDGLGVEVRKTWGQEINSSIYKWKHAQQKRFPKTSRTKQ